MTSADLDTVQAIETASFSRPWTREHFAAELDSPGSFPGVAVDAGGRVIGYLCPVLIGDEAEIHDVAVALACRGVGVGRALVAWAFEEFRRRGAAVIHLEVRPSNLAAIALYERFGFRVTSRRRAYYENGEDALLMSCQLTQEE